MKMSEKTIKCCRNDADVKIAIFFVNVPIYIVQNIEINSQRNKKYTA